MLSVSTILPKRGGRKVGAKKIIASAFDSSETDNQMVDENQQQQQQQSLQLQQSIENQEKLKKVMYQFITNQNPRGYDLASRVSFLLPDDVIINQYLYDRGAQYDVIDATCCPLMQFRPIVKVEKSKFACVGILDSTHPHSEDVSAASDMLLRLQSPLAKRTYDALQAYKHVIHSKQQLREEMKSVNKDVFLLQAKVHEAHLSSQKVFEQMLQTASKDEFFYFHYKRFDVETISHKLECVGHNANLSELFAGNNDQNLTSLYMKKKGFPTYLDARGFLNFSLALFEKRDTFETTFVTFDGFIVPMVGKYTRYLLNQVEIIPGKYYDGDLAEFMVFSINPNIVKHIRESRLRDSTLTNAIENFEYDMHSEIFISKFYPSRLEQLNRAQSTFTSTSASSSDSSESVDKM